MRRISWQAKRQAERAMTMRVRVERGTGETVLDPATLREAPVHVAVWDGRGKIAPSTQFASDVEVAGSAVPYTGMVLHLPVAGPDLFSGDVVRIVEDRFGGMAGRVFSVTQPSRRKTHATALRVPVEEVTPHGVRAG